MPALALRYSSMSGVSETAGETLVALRTELGSSTTRTSFLDAEVVDPIFLRDSLLMLGRIIRSDQRSLFSLTTAEIMARMDPVTTVDRDRVLFECFSVDESTFGKLSLADSAFKNQESREKGTTNVEFSDDFQESLKLVRSNRSTRLNIDPRAVGVSSGRGVGVARKVRLPGSWFRGFQELSVAMTSRMLSFDLHPMELQKVLHFLRGHKESSGPRALRWELAPGKPVKAVFEPWEENIECRSLYPGPEKQVIRTWGRRRLLLLQDALPLARNLSVHLMGDGMPTFYVLDLRGGYGSFTFGVTPWTDQDWTQSSKTRLFRATRAPDAGAVIRVHDTLSSKGLATIQELAEETGLDQDTVLGAIAVMGRNGDLTFDIDLGKYRYRCIKNFSHALKLDVEDKREKGADALLAKGNVRDISNERVEDGERIHALVSGEHGRYETSVILSSDGEILEGSCECRWFRQWALRWGPCKHLLALRKIGRAG